ncbi:phosphonate C-P lyase system protein PhnG [Nocardia sp. NPDC004711]
MKADLTREKRCQLLAVAEPADLIALAERVLSEGSTVEIVHPPQVGTMALQVREPVVGERFLLADVLVTEVRVEIDGHTGWAMRLGEDTLATTAAALCDAAVEAATAIAPDVLDLCEVTATRIAEQSVRERRELASTIVQFEER